VVVSQQSVDLVRARTERVSVKLAERIDETIASRILREVPRASDRPPSAALTQAGGGGAALDPRAATEPKTLQTYFEFEVELERAAEDLPEAPPPSFPGSRALVVDESPWEREVIAKELGALGIEVETPRRLRPRFERSRGSRSRQPFSLLLLDARGSKMRSARRGFPRARGDSHRLPPHHQRVPPEILRSHDIAGTLTSRSRPRTSCGRSRS
jgi:hypothetical protein